MRKVLLALFLSCIFVTAAFADAKVVANIEKSKTNSSLVSAVTARKIRVTSLILVAGATATNVTLRSKPAGSGTEITALIALGANGILVLPYRADGWFETVAGEALTVTTGDGATTGIMLTYVLAN